MDAAPTSPDAWVFRGTFSRENAEELMTRAMVCWWFHILLVDLIAAGLPGAIAHVDIIVENGSMYKLENESRAGYGPFESLDALVEYYHHHSVPFWGQEGIVLGRGCSACVPGIDAMAKEIAKSVTVPSYVFRKCCWSVVWFLMIFIVVMMKFGP